MIRERHWWVYLEYSNSIRDTEPLSDSQLLSDPWAFLPSEDQLSFCSQLGRDRKREGWFWSSWTARESMSNGVYVVNEQKVSSREWLWLCMSLVISSTMSGLLPLKHLLQERVTQLRSSDLHRGRKEREKSTGGLSVIYEDFTSSLTHQTPPLKPDIYIKALPSSFLNFKDQICCETLSSLFYRH